MPVYDAPGYLLLLGMKAGFFQGTLRSPPITFEGIRFSPQDQENRKALVRAQILLEPYEL